MRVSHSLEDDGIKPSVTFVSDMLGNPVGGIRQGFTEADNLGVNFVVDMEKRYGVRGGNFLLSMSQRLGRSLSEEYIGNTFSTQQVWGGPTFKVINVAYEQTIGDDDVEFLIGRIAAGDDFLVSQYNYGFVQNGFCGNPVGIFFNVPGMSAYPNATWGSVLQVRPSERTYLMGGLYNGDATIRDLNNHGLDLSIDGPPFAIVEFAYEHNQRPNDNGFVGNYKKRSAWFDGNEYANLEQQALSQVQPGIDPETHEGNYGFYGLFDQVLVRFDDRSEKIARGLGVVASCLVSPDESISQMPYFFNAGIAARGLNRQRPATSPPLESSSANSAATFAPASCQAAKWIPRSASSTTRWSSNGPTSSASRTARILFSRTFSTFSTPAARATSPMLVVGTQVGVNF